MNGKKKLAATAARQFELTTHGGGIGLVFLSRRFRRLIFALKFASIPQEQKSKASIAKNQMLECK